MNQCMIKGIFWSHMQTQLNSTENTPVQPPSERALQCTDLRGAAGILPQLSLLKPCHRYKRDCFSGVLLPPSRFILHGNSSQQLLLPKKEVSASSEVARHEYLHCKSSSKSNTCPARKEAPDLPAQENHTTPLQTNTYKNLPCTPTDQLFTKIKQWILLRNDLILRKMQVSPGLFRNSLSIQKAPGFRSLSQLQRGRKTQQQCAPSL